MQYKSCAHPQTGHRRTLRLDTYEKQPLEGQSGMWIQQHLLSDFQLDGEGSVEGLGTFSTI